MGKRVRWSGLILVFTLVAVFSLSVGYAQASPASYAIDEVYDNVNGDWFAATPTLSQGASYDLTIVGSGASGSILGEYAELFVSEGLFINYGAVGTDWDSFSGSPVVSQVAIGNPIISLNHTYTVNGSFTVPNSAPTGPGEALVWLDASFLSPPVDGADLFDRTFLTGELASQEFDVNVVPEPTTLLLMSLGIPGLLLGKRKKRA